jgi:ABC-type phosphate/phosphonate transport system ATPase subunit
MKKNEKSERQTIESWLKENDVEEFMSKKSSKMTPLELHRNRLAHSMAPEAEVILSLVAEYGPLSIMQVMDLAQQEQIGSPATIHKYLRHVRDAELLIELASDTDHRSTTLDVSKKGIRYLRSLA